MSSPLAIHGGSPLTDRQWPAYNTIGHAEKAEVLDVLSTGKLSEYHASAGSHFLGGPKVRRLEADWADRFGVKHAVAMNSATSCLWAGLAALGLAAGDEVIVPQLGMCAAVTMVKLVGATPVYVDCDPVTMLMDPDAAAAAVTDRTRAILPVHLAGQPAPMEPIMALASRHGLKVIEDNAQSPGAGCGDRWAGSIGDIGVFSLNCHKIIQCGEGGVACTDDAGLALRLQLLRNHGEKCSTAMGLSGASVLGMNLRMTELQAAVAIHQLAKLDMLNAHTQRLAAYLTSRLQLPGIDPPQPQSGCSHVYYIYHWSYRAKQVGVPAVRFAEAVAAEGLPVYAHYGYLISRLPGFEDAALGNPLLPHDARYPGACRSIADSLWTMLLRYPLCESDVDLLIAAMRKVYEYRHLLVST